MKTLTKILVAVDFLLIMFLVTLQIGCMTANSVNSTNVASSPLAVVTNSVDGQVESPSFNTEDYVWDTWKPNERKLNDVK